MTRWGLALLLTAAALGACVLLVCGGCGQVHGGSGNVPDAWAGSSGSDGGVESPADAASDTGVVKLPGTDAGPPGTPPADASFGATVCAAAALDASCGDLQTDPRNCGSSKIPVSSKQKETSRDGGHS